MLGNRLGVKCLESAISNYVFYSDSKLIWLAHLSSASFRHVIWMSLTGRTVDANKAYGLWCVLLACTTPLYVLHMSAESALERLWMKWSHSVTLSLFGGALSLWVLSARHALGNNLRSSNSKRRFPTCKFDIIWLRPRAFQATERRTFALSWSVKTDGQQISSSEWFAK